MKSNPGLKLTLNFFEPPNYTCCDYLDTFRFTLLESMDSTNNTVSVEPETNLVAELELRQQTTEQADVNEGMLKCHLSLCKNVKIWEILTQE